MSGGFQPNGFQGPPGFQQFADRSGPISQTLPAFTQSATGVVDSDVIPEEPGLGGGIFLGPGFMAGAGVRGKIAQTLPSLTQQAFGEVNDDELVLLLLMV